MRKYLDLIWLRGIGALKADTKQSYLGMLWWILEPLLMAALFYLAFASGVRGGGQSGSSFVYFLLTGLFPFKWTASALTASSNSLINSKGILGQTYLPKWIFPSVANLTALIRFAFVFPLMLLLVIMGGYEPTSDWLSIVNVILCQILFNLSISFFLAATVPLIPDLTHVVPLIVMAMMFTSGIFFDISERPEEIQAILRLNPFVTILEGYRDVLLHGRTANLSALVYPFIASISAFAAGIALLIRFDRYYPRALP
ncbi:ABC transporter permease [Microbulbifer marinus]|uniref:Transport permease protein n=1 Tax=Microbulbifer marinus TaxID=658218 RepID=A0A1H3VVP6_9GAMM|nr:ABC transporter permease [Microbulbifer marinus]SDZ78840.1 lipopolysaccharide transport system permease protein [Microbulbifer marinus]